MSTDRARALRARMSPPEARMWNVLRREPLACLHFRRQVEIGPYYVDFVTHAPRLVIEVDGRQHFTHAEEHYDNIRDAFLASRGYRVLRFTSADVLNDLDGVLAAILAAVGDTC